MPEIYQTLGENALLLCWEKPGDACHRRFVAEWLEAALGIEIPEYGFDRSVSPLYEEMVWAVKRRAGASTVESEAESDPADRLRVFGRRWHYYSCQRIRNVVESVVEQTDQPRIHKRSLMHLFNACFASREGSRPFLGGGTT